MKRMLCLKNATHIVFFDCADERGAKAFRKNNPEFKRRKIRDVIQAYPDQTLIGVVLEIEGIIHGG